MLVGPAGYGKTTLARQWLANRRFAWFAATSAAGDVAALAAGIAEAVSKVAGNRSSSVLNRLSGGFGLPHEPSELAELQIEELSSWPTDAWLAIDEYEWLVASGAADEYVRLLLEGSTLNLLLTSRARPTWATARKRLYGDFALVDRTLLKMDSLEARQVLEKANRPISDTLLERAAGWPAVLGLAALSPAEHISDAIPETLFEYLAEELFNKSSRLLRDTLPLLALAPRVSPQVAAAVCQQSEAEPVIHQAVEAGYVTDSDGAPSFHPLLKSFLLAKLNPTDERALGASANLISLFLQSCAWDDAFHVAQNLANPQPLLQLIETGYEPLLRSGRTATLSEWLDTARRQEIGTSLLDLIEAELLAREGRMRLAERMALYVAHNGEPSIRFRALCIAGRTAHLDNRESDCRHHFRAAEAVAHDEHERHEATWGALLSASAFRADDQLQVELAAFLEYEPRGPDDVVRACIARLIAGVSGDLANAVQDALPLMRLRSSDVDPVILTSFRHAVARSLMLLGRYEEALEVANDTLALAEATRLAFVVPHALVSRAGALLGLGLYGDARTTLAEAEERASNIGDQHNLVDVRTVRAKLAISTGEPDRATTLTDDEVFGVTDGMLGDYRATNALALACAGRTPEAERILATLDAFRLQEVRSLISATRAVLAARAGDRDAVNRELLSVKASGVVDPILIAKRGSAELSEVMEDLTLPGIGAGAMMANHPSSFANEAHALASLTKRELEVLALLRLGNTNREIAAKLVIEEVTAKVHVSHILRKLGVRSRTEAAVLAMKLASEGATPQATTSRHDSR